MHRGGANNNHQPFRRRSDLDTSSLEVVITGDDVRLAALALKDPNSDPFETCVLAQALNRTYGKRWVVGDGLACKVGGDEWLLSGEAKALAAAYDDASVKPYTAKKAERVRAFVGRTIRLIP